MASVITLLTDFGTQDEYVGVMKGVILSINPSAVVVDVTHAIPPQAVRQAAYMIPAYAPYFPEKTIHVIVVDPGVGGSRRILAADIDGHVFLAPDNGVLTRMADDAAALTIRAVEQADYFLTPVSRTFHGRDIFAPVAAHLSTGAALSDLGPPVKSDDIVRTSFPKPAVSAEGSVTGEIIGVDRFGNLITNIRAGHIQAEGAEPKAGICIRVGSETISGLSQSYSDAGPENLLAIAGGRGYLEIAVSGGSARQRLKVDPGDAVAVIYEP